jgi:hypothetical protein
MALDDVLTQRRWDLQDGLWLLMGVYISRPEEVGKLYERAAQVTQNAIDKYALGTCEPLEKARSLIDIRSALRNYRDTRYHSIKSNNKELKWPELEVDHHVPFEESGFAKSELYLISMKVAKLYKQFEKTAELEYCELPYVSSKGNLYKTSPLSQWNSDYLIKWGAKVANIDLGWLETEINRAENSAAAIEFQPHAMPRKFEVVELSRDIRWPHMWVYDQLASHSRSGRARPTMSEMVQLMETNKLLKKVHGEDIYFLSADADEPFIWSKSALKMFILRHTKVK